MTRAKFTALMILITFVMPGGFLLASLALFLLKKRKRKEEGVAGDRPSSFDDIPCMEGTER